MKQLKYLQNVGKKSINTRAIQKIHQFLTKLIDQFYKIKNNVLFLQLVKK